MNRSNSRSKWKDVLGFDDGSLPSPVTTYRYRPLASVNSNDSADLAYASQDDYPFFPRAMTISYHPNAFRRDLIILPFLPVPKYGPEDKDDSSWQPKIGPLFYVTVREDPQSTSSASRNSNRIEKKGTRIDEIQTSRPELVLHQGRRPSSRVLAVAKFHSVTMCTDITLSPPSNPNSSGPMSLRSLSSSGMLDSAGARPPTSPSESGFEKPKWALGKDDSGRPRFRIVRISLRGGDGGVLRRGRWGFELLGGSGGGQWARRDVFEWKKDRTGDVSGLRDLCGLALDWGFERDRQFQRLKLVNSRTGNVVAGFVRAEDDEASLGIFRFYGDEIGGEFDVVAVMSLLSVVERGRRKGSNRLSRAFRTK